MEIPEERASDSCQKSNNKTVDDSLGARKTDKSYRDCRLKKAVVVIYCMDWNTLFAC